MPLRALWQDGAGHELHGRCGDSNLQVYVFPRHLQVQYPGLEVLLPWWVPDSSSQSFRMGASEYDIWCKTGMGLLLNFPTMGTTTVKLY